MRDVFVLHGAYGPRLTPYGCTFIRLLLPLSHPSVSGSIRLSHGTEPPDRADVVIVERTWKEGTTVADAERLVALLRRKRIPVLYALDDDLLDLDPRDVSSAAVAEEIHRVVAFLAREAAGVLVSTCALAERMQPLNAHIAVVPNHLDERLFGKPPAREERQILTIGYMGTHTHERDLRTVLRGLRELMGERAGRVRLEFAGGTADNGFLTLFAGLNFKSLDRGDEDDYPHFVPWMRRNLDWDVAIAPLEDSRFHRCKSDIKFLDYALLGVPAVYSAVGPYLETVEDRVTGLVVPTTPDSFRDALGELLDDSALRRSIAGDARQKVLASRTLETGAHLWPEAIEGLLSRSGSA